MRDYQTRTNVFDNATVAAGGNNTSTEVDVDEKVDDIAVAYDIGGSGTPKAELQVKIGTDASGSALWATASSSTNATDVLTYDKPAEGVRLKVSETGGTSGLSGIEAHVLVRG